MGNPTYLPLRPTSSSSNRDDDDAPPLPHTPSPASSYLPSFLKHPSHSSSKLPFALPKPVHLISGFILFLILFSIFGAYHTDRLPAIASLSFSHKICDPFSSPGQVTFPEGLNPTWVPFDRRCAPAPDWLAFLAKVVERNTPQQEGSGEGAGRVKARQEQIELPNADLQGIGRFDPLDHMRGKYILVLGDSVDRNGLEQIAVLTKATFHTTSYEREVQGQPAEMEGWNFRGIPHVVEFPGTDGFRIVNAFFYGLDDQDEFSAQWDWHGPGLFETRADQLFKPLTDGLGQRPAAIQLHSGLWDLALFGRQDRKLDVNLTEPISQERAEWWQTRMRSVIRKTKQTWPGVPIWFRMSHRVGDGAFASRDWSPGINMDVPFHNFFTDIRTHQIRNMQRAVCEEAGIPIFDFGEMWEGQQQYQDKVHPLTFPGGALYGEPLLHHFWMEMLGRRHWSPRIREGLERTKTG